ncbi:hypothetical protein Smic_16520 [Streptomyces microflavus]|uniref:Uncharacterized protein n=1 Tax=Streptomyces microflavus TaxID=1919 RepID=A0A7J0CKU1_STRMI|nr:hypothetical protein Smic_16520 [Streptomyces microflavus]
MEVADPEGEGGAPVRLLREQLAQLGGAELLTVLGESRPLGVWLSLVRLAAFIPDISPLLLVTRLPRRPSNLIDRGAGWRGREPGGGKAVRPDTLGVSGR